VLYAHGKINEKPAFFNRVFVCPENCWITGRDHNAFLNALAWCGVGTAPNACISGVFAIHSLFGASIVSIPEEAVNPYHEVTKPNP
jgi:hypothetical protein